MGDENNHPECSMVQKVYAEVFGNGTPEKSLRVRVGLNEEHMAEMRIEMRRLVKGLLAGVWSLVLIAFGAFINAVIN